MLMFESPHLVFCRHDTCEKYNQLSRGEIWNDVNKSRGRDKSYNSRSRNESRRRRSRAETRHGDTNEARFSVGGRSSSRRHNRENNHSITRPL